MRGKRQVAWLAFLALAAMACGLFGDDGPPGDAEVITVMANTGLQGWLEEVVPAFNEAGVENEAGRPVYVELALVEAGEAVVQLSEGGGAAALWIPDGPVWTDVAAEQGNAAYGDDCLSVAESPLVIALWRPLAESLGWPGRNLGWFDIDSLASDPTAWDYYSGGQFGETLRIGHTHPGLSGSGMSTLLAIVHAAEAQPGAVTEADVEQPLVEAAVRSFESSVTTFSSSTAQLGQAMSERGAEYLGAAVMYESTVVEQENPDLIPIYPFEGTFVATHPACINGEAAAEQQEAAAIFRDYLLGAEAQEVAAAHGLRPAQGEVAAGAALDEASGVDLAQPATVFAAPSVDTVYAVQTLWQEARKDVNLVMLLDTSGSMAGEKMENSIEAAAQFVEQMGDDDFISIIAFATEPQVIVHHQQVGPARDEIQGLIRQLVADGDTTLYDAIGDGAALLAETANPETSNALVVLTDGMDTRSYRYSFDQAAEAATASGTTVFTIAYGGDADEDLLAELAAEANGNFYRGDEASIAAIYDEMSAAFGGSLGIGR